MEWHGINAWAMREKPGEPGCWSPLQGAFLTSPGLDAIPLHTSAFWVFRAGEIQEVALNRSEVPSARDAPTFEDPESAR